MPVSQVMKVILVLVALTCVQAQTSCEGRCSLGTDPGAQCQCNPSCSDFGDCCDDYADICLTCKGRCGPGTDPNYACQCNDACSNFGDCCSDFNEECEGGSGEISDEDLYAITAAMLEADENNVGSMVTYNIGGSTSGCGDDQAPGPLFPSGLPEGLETIGIYAQFLALMDNYVSDVTVAEDEDDPVEEAEIDAFMAAMMTTQPMILAVNFLLSNNVVASEQEFLDTFREMWFGLYSRSDVLGSCGFEHVFIGETRSSGITGVHGWIHFAQEEVEGDKNYNGHMTYVDVGAKGNALELSFEWNDNNKEEKACKQISSIFVGASPEYELAAMTICWMVRPNSQCPVDVGGNRVNIQTYTEDGKYVGTAYFDVSP